jgi:S-DNA-T family DNA segregation ATPase FtsK/SpoIIIE
LYEIVPAPGIKISKIRNLEDDIALSLAALGIRIIAPIPGKGTIGIEIPNSHPEMVTFRSVIGTEKFRDTKAELPIAIGKTITNEVYIADLTKMPHLLIAGATGQGKSVGLNNIIASILYKKHPSQIKFVLIDPKKVEMPLYQPIEQHFLAKLPNYEDAIITDSKQVIHVLNSLCMEMDSRYDLLKMAHTRNITEYNRKFMDRKLNPLRGHKFLPYIVLVIDELADLMMTAGKEVETPIARLAQLARAVGIHLVVATQRPSVNVITGIIKANFPTRVSYKVSSKIDSRTILDQGGADRLIGRGDMLLSNGSDLIRIQNAFIDTPEVEKLVAFISEQTGYPEPYYLPEVMDESDADEEDDFEPGEKDRMFDDAARLIVRHQQGSTSLIQRRLKLGYNRAGRIMDQLERSGIVGPTNGSKPRDVLVHTEADLEQFLNRNA